MKTMIDTVNILLVDGKQALHYRLLDDKGTEMKRGVAFVVLDPATVDTVRMDAIAKLAADVDALKFAPDAAPQAITDAVATLGLQRQSIKQEEERLATARAAADQADALAAQKREAAAKAARDLDATQLVADEAIAQKQAEKDRLDVEIAAKRAALADIVPAAAETKPGGLTT